MSYQNNLESALKSIKSAKDHDEVQSMYTGTGEAMKHTGAPTNHMLLAMIHSETRRNADEMMRLNGTMQKLLEQISISNSNMSTIGSLLETQNEILSSSIVSGQNLSSETSVKRQSVGDSDWYYQGVRLSSRYHAYACIVFHLIGMVQIHLDQMGKIYPDSVDCDFKTMTQAVRIVCDKRCNISSVSLKSKIDTKKMDDQSFDMIYPHISSRDKNSATTMPESALSRLDNNIVRPVLQDVEWIRQRLSHLQGILSIKQVDILKRIRFPFAKGGELNWDSRGIDPRSSHPLAREIAELPSNQKWEYIQLVMKGEKMQNALTAAKEFKKR